MVPLTSSVVSITEVNLIISSDDFCISALKESFSSQIIGKDPVLKPSLEFSGNNFNNDLLDEVQSLNDSKNDELMYQDYIVKKRETLYGIASSVLGDAKKWSLIYEWNKEVMGFDSTLIYPYQVLKMKVESIMDDNVKKEDSRYVVRDGDTLWKIAEQTYGDPYAWKLLLHDNKQQFDDPNKIKINQELIVRSPL